MKTRPGHISLCLSALLLLLSCGKLSLSEQGEKTTVVIEAGGKAVKSLGNVSDAEKNITRLDAFAFRPSGFLDGMASGVTNPLIVECTTGERDFLVFANLASTPEIADRQTLLAQTLDLTSEKISALTMSAEGHLNVLSSGGSLSMPLKRYVSKAQVSKVSYRMQGNSYEGLPFNLNSIYLTNVIGRVNLAGNPSGDIWLNPFTDTSDPSQDGVLKETLNLPLSNGQSHDNPVHLYMYPNPTESDSFEYSGTFTPRLTRLVLEASIGSGTQYYPVTLPKGGRNHSYVVNECVIARQGSTHPETPLSYVAMTFEPWIDVDGMDTETPDPLGFDAIMLNMAFCADGVDPFELFDQNTIISSKQPYIILSDGSVSPFGALDVLKSVIGKRGIIYLKDGTIIPFDDIPENLDFGYVEKIVLLVNDASLKDFLENELGIPLVVQTSVVLICTTGSLEAFPETARDLILHASAGQPLVLLDSSEIAAFKNLTDNLDFGQVNYVTFDSSTDNLDDFGTNSGDLTLNTKP